MADVLMPKLSDTMEEGKILRWLKRPGEHVEEGDLLVEVETDKADMEVEADVAGVLREVKLEEGQSGKVGAVIAVIDDDGAAAQPAPAASRPAPRREPAKTAAAAEPAARAKPPAAAPRPREERPEGGEGAAAAAKEAEAGAAPEPASGPADDQTPTAPQDRETAPAPAEAAAPARREGTGDAAPRPAPSTARPAPTAKGKVRVSPLARTLAAELGIDPETVPGTGPGGRVVRRDVEAAARARSGTAPGAPAAPAKPRPAASVPGTPVARPAARPAPAEAPATGDGVRRVPLSAMRASIARRMSESKREAPHFYLTTVVDMDAAHRLREELRGSGTVAADVTLNHMIVKAAADALRAFPEVNARFAGDAVEILDRVHIGIATAVPDGLIVPVVHDADRKSLVEIAATARALGEKAKARSFAGDDLSGATFTVSNLGMYDVESFIAVINPPQAAILAVGAVAQRPFVRDGELVAAYTATLTLSCDHRAIDGARGAEFLRDLKDRLAHPTRLLFPAAPAAAEPVR